MSQQTLEDFCRNDDGSDCYTFSQGYGTITVHDYLVGDGTESMTFSTCADEHHVPGADPYTSTACSASS